MIKFAFLLQWRKRKKISIRHIFVHLVRTRKIMIFIKKVLVILQYQKVSMKQTKIILANIIEKMLMISVDSVNTN